MSDIIEGDALSILRRIVREISDEPIFSPSMTYGDAKTWIKNRVRPEVPGDFVGTVVIEVLS